MKEERIEFEMNGEKHYVVLKEMTFGEFNDFLRNATEVKIEGGQVKMDIDFQKFREMIILKSIKEASFKVTIDEIRKLPREIGEMLFEKAQELNPFR